MSAAYKEYVTINNGYLEVVPFIPKEISFWLMADSGHGAYGWMGFEFDFTETMFGITFDFDAEPKLNLPPAIGGLP